MFKLKSLSCLAILLVLATRCAEADVLLPSPQGGEVQNRNRPPDYEAVKPSPLALPPVKPLPQSGKISAGFRLFVRAYRFVGNRAIPSKELETVAAPYTGRTVDSADLEKLRHDLTLLYVKKGFINSGAVLPDQEVKDHVVTFRIVEGKLDAVNVTGTRRLKVDYVRNRILLGAGPPLNVNALQERLRLLQQNSLIEKINANLSPGTRQGGSVLDVAVHEARPYQVDLTFDNHISPSVGPYHATLHGVHRDLTGRGDSLDASYGYTLGVSDYSIHYAIPIDAQDTLLGIGYSKNDFAVIESPFDQLSIRSYSSSKTVSLERPVIRHPGNSLLLGLSVEERSNQTFMLGVPFSFTPGIPNGTSAEQIARFYQEWDERGVDQVFTLRSTFTAGTTNALPKVGNTGPDKHFVVWLAQSQWAKRLEQGDQIILLANLQYTPQSLLILEKLGIGGASTVRGYRETQLLRDNGYILSAEYRKPVFFDREGASRTQLACFVDYGKGWNTDHTADLPADIASAGLGILWNPTSQWQSQLYVAKPFRNFPVTGRRDLQDMGIHFLMNYRFFKPDHA
ncbi:MAG: ShlB/FhaC/HecB family hemolysin secretion/activation protein [Burkholderiales bacterium]|nr:ShlB/FhaC/HecB family hemolysin secretion/activation protein [Burkholderiales bacterium]